MHDAASLNQMLSDRMEEVCLHLLPNGKREGNKWVVGSIDGNSGHSLQVTISGGSVGRFIDFADTTSKGATPLWLWCKTKKVNFPEACKQAAEWLGVKSEDFGVKRHHQKQYLPPSPADRNGVRLTESNTEVMDYLTMTRRLDPLVVAKARIGETKDGKWIVFPYFEPGSGEAFHIKRMMVERPEGRKEITASKGTRRSLYGKDMIGEEASELIIAEGEIDKLSWQSWGYNAVSVPNGVQDFQWVENDWDWLQRFEKIYVAMDMDEPGAACAQEICKRLGLHRCYIVELPHKDANDCLVAGLKADTMDKCLSSAKAIDLDEIKRPDDFRKDVIEHYTNDPSTIGFDTPWYPQVPWRVRPGEFTVLSGFSGSGKTQGLNQLMLHLVQQGLKVMDASLEIRPGLTLYYMTRCAMAKRNATASEASACLNWLNDNVFFLDCIGTVTIDRIIHAMEYARKRHGVDVFVIDSLFKCGLNSEDYGAARVFVDKLTSFCNNTRSHVILVAHSRKTQTGNELSVPSKSDIAGSSDIANAAFNVIIFWRNKLKKRKMDEARQKNDIETLAAQMDEPDGKIMLDKQRFGEGEESVAMVWYHSESCQFHTVRNKSIPYFEVK